MAVGRVDDMPNGIHGHQCPYSRTIYETHAGSANTTGAGSCGTKDSAYQCPGSCTDATFVRPTFPGGLTGRVSKRRIRPGRVLAVEIEEHSRRDDRHRPCRARPAVAAFAEPPHYTLRGCKTKGAAARQQDRMDPVDKVFGAQEVGFARAGRAAAHSYPGHSPCGTQADRTTGLPCRVGRMPDGQTRDQ